MIKEVSVELIAKAQKYIDGLKGAKVATDQFTDSSVKSFDKVKSGVGKLSGGMAMFSGMLGANLVASSFQQLAADAVNHARQIDDAEDRLNVTLTRTNLSLADQRKEFERLTKESAPKLADAYAMPEEQVLSLSSTIMAFSGKTGKELDDLVNISLGASTAMGMSAEGVARIIAKGAGEAEGSLTRLGVKFPENATDAQRAAIIQKEFGASIQATKDASDDAFGALDRLKNDVFHWLGSNMGGVISAIQPFVGIMAALPAVMGLYTAATEFATSATMKHRLATISSGIAQAAAAVKTGLLTAAIWLLNAATGANPLGALILGIVALVGVIVLAYNKSEWFRKQVDALWEGIKRLGLAIWEGIKFWAEWLNPIGLLVKAFKLLYDNVEFVRVAIDGLIQAVADAGKWITDLLGITDEDIEKKGKQAEATKVVKKTTEELTAELTKQIEAWNAVGEAMEKSLGDKTSIATQKLHELKMAVKSGNKDMIADAEKAYAAAFADAKDFAAAKAALDKNSETVKNALAPKKKDKGDKKDAFQEGMDKLRSRLEAQLKLEDVYVKQGTLTEKEAALDKQEIRSHFYDQMLSLARKNRKGTDDILLEMEESDADFIVWKNGAWAKLFDEIHKKREADRKREEEDAKQRAEWAKKRFEEEFRVREALLNLSPDGAEKEIALLDFKYQKELVMTGGHLQNMILLQMKYLKERGSLLEKHIQDENLLYKAGAKFSESITEGLANDIKKTFAILFGWEKREKDKASKQDDVRAEQDKDDKIKALADQVRENAISYEEYTNKKRELDEEYLAAKEEKANLEKGIVASSLQSALDMTIDIGRQVVTEQIKQELMKTAGKQVAASGSVIASIMSTFGWFGIPLIAGALALIGSLFSKIMSGIQGFADGGRIKDGTTDTADDVLMKGSKDEFVVKARSAKKVGYDILDYINEFGELPKRQDETDLGVDESLRIGKFQSVVNRVGRYLRSIFSGKADAASVSRFERYQKQTITPRPNPILNSQSTGGLSPQSMKALENSINSLVEKGVMVRVDAVLKAKGDDLAATIRKTERSVSTRADVQGGGFK